MAIDRYIMTLRARLPVLSDESAEMIEEVRAHLEETAAELQLRGLHPAESERAAVQRCGPVDAVAQAIIGRQDEGMKRHGNRMPVHVLRRPAAALLLAAALTIVGGSAALAHSSPAPHTVQTPSIPHTSGGTR